MNNDQQIRSGGRGRARFFQNGSATNGNQPTIGALQSVPTSSEPSNVSTQPPNANGQNAFGAALVSSLVKQPPPPTSSSGRGYSPVPSSISTPSLPGGRGRLLQMSSPSTSVSEERGRFLQASSHPPSTSSGRGQASATTSISSGRGQRLPSTDGSSGSPSLYQLLGLTRDSSGRVVSSSQPTPSTSSGRAKLLAHKITGPVVTPPPVLLGRGRHRPLTADIGSESNFSQATNLDVESTVFDPKEMENAEEPKPRLRPSNVTDLSSQLESASLDESRSSRPEKPVVDRGNEGTKINVMTNFIKLNFIDKKCVLHYMISFEPEVDDIITRKDMVVKHLPIKQGIRCYDGGNILYLPDRLEKDVMQFTQQHPFSGETITMTVSFKRNLTLGECTPLFGTLIRRCVDELRMARIGRNYFNPKAAIDVPENNVSIWPGYVTSVQEKEDGVYLEVDLLSRVLRKDTALHVLAQAAQSRNYQEEALKGLIGAAVMTHYNKRLYRVDDIAWDKTPLSTFDTKGGGTMTFKDYYWNQYQIKIMDDKQPLLISRQKKQRTIKGGVKEPEISICLVPELSNMTGLTDAMRNNFQFMKRIAEYTRLTPAQRVYGLKGFLKLLKENEKARQMLADWGLEVPDEAQQLEARIIESPKIKFGREHLVDHANADWSRDLRRAHIFRGIDLTCWLLVYTENDRTRAIKFRDTLMRTGPGMGVHIAKPRERPLRSDRINDISSALREELKDTSIQAVVVIMRSQRDDVYATIKKLCLVQENRPVPVQCLLSNTLSRDDRVRSIVQNIALQIMAKLGGALWVVPTPLVSTMVIGIDTYHDPGGLRSVGASVCSLDSQFTAWHSQACLHMPGEEVLKSLGAALFNAFAEYSMRNGKLPDRIIVYRDGVDEGTFSFLKDREIRQMRHACSAFNASYKPKIIFIIVIKRFTLKYFMDNGRDAENVKYGAVLDHSVTRRDYRDFFLVSQLVRHGTASPTNYVVLYDDENWKIDRHQKLAYLFTHMYYNWPGTVRVPAPCLYAHKLAQLVGMYLKTPAHQALRTQLHYL